jgi:hypothetical protein
MFDQGHKPHRKEGCTDLKFTTLKINNYHNHLTKGGLIEKQIYTKISYRARHPGIADHHYSICHIKPQRSFTRRNQTPDSLWSDNPP